jgi:lysine-ketoglutarate reductase/saccharopine dehydrogenase-like protein (TIGR00300 family)
MNFKLREYTAPDFSAEPFISAPDVKLTPAEMDRVAPDDYHAMSIFPEYFKIDGKWLLAEESRMDCVAVYENKKVKVTEFRNIRKGDLVICGRSEDGREGIYLHEDGFNEGRQASESFAFRQSRSRESSFSWDYDELFGVLNHDRDHGKIVWVLGPAVSFDSDAREYFGRLVRNGYVHALLAGNALATHDLEGAWLQTALGQNIYTQQHQPNGHYNHLDLLNRVRKYGSIPEFIEKENIDNGIIYSLEQQHIPYVLAGSIRDDGPLPPVYGNVYEAQERMRDEIRSATTVISVATMLHSIAVGNMTPSFRVLPDGTVRQVYFYCVDVAEFTVNKLSDRGSLAAKGIVTNVQDFVTGVARNLGL